MDLDYLQAKEDELKSRLEACLKHAELEELRNEYDVELAELQQQVAATKAQFSELSLHHEVELESVRSAADREIQRLLGQHRQELQQLTTRQLSTDQRQYESALGDHQAELRQLQRSHDNTINALQQQLTLTQEREVDLHAELESWKSRHSHLERERFELESQLHGMESKQSELQSLLQRLQQEQLAAETKLIHHRELASQGLQQQVVGLKQDSSILSERLVQQAEQHAKAISRVQQQKEDSCKQVDAQLKAACQEIEDLQKAMQRHRQDMNRLRKQHAEQVAGMEADHKTVLATQRTHSQDMASQDRQRLQSQIAELRKDNARLNADLATTRASLQDTEQRLRVSQARHEAQHRELVTKLKDSVLEENDRTSKQVQQQHAMEINELRSQLQRLQLSSRLELESFQESYSQDMQMKSKQFDEIQRQQQERETEALQQLQAVTEQLHTLEDRHQQELLELTESRDRERQQQDANLLRVTTQARDIVERERRALLQRHQDDLQQATNALTDTLKQSEQQYGDELEQLKAQNTALISRLEAAEDRLLLANSRAEHEIDQYKAAHASTSKREEENLRQQLQQVKLEKKHLTEESVQLQQSTQRRLADLQARHEADFKSRLDTGLQKEYEQTIDALQRQVAALRDVDSD